MKPSKEFEDRPHSVTTKEEPAKGLSHAVPRLAPFAFCDSAGYYYDRPKCTVKRFATAEALKEFSKEDLRKNPLNWKLNLLTR